MKFETRSKGKREEENEKIFNEDGSINYDYLRKSKIKVDPVNRIVPVIVTVCIAIFANWLLLPAWNIHSEGFWAYWIFIIFVAANAVFMTDIILDKGIQRDISILIKICCVLLIIIIILSLASSKIFNAIDYSNLIEIKEGNFGDEIQSISTAKEAKEFPMLDVETAQKLGDRSLSEIDKVSQFEVNGEYNLITYNNKQYRLSPLEYSSIFRAMNNESITGYVLVDTETQESHLVQLDNEIKYAPSDIFSQDLTRYLRKQYPRYIFDKYQFDIDDNGEAYYIAPVLEPTIGFFGGKIVQSFVIVNANTGECEEYSPEDLPEWVDHAYSLDYLMELAEIYYQYKGGFWNTIFSKTNVRKISYSYRGENISEEEEENRFVGYNSIMTKDGVQFFTCVVSASNDESALGFILANCRTGEITYYDCAGAEESTAQLQAESLYQNYGYTSSYPLMVSVDGVPTYAISLKDKSKINKAYVMINVENYTLSASGETLEDALLQYRKKIFGEEGLTPEDLTGETSEGVETETKSKTGTITELYQAIQNNTTQFFFVLEGDENLYISSISNNSRQVQMSVGDKVSIDYYMSTDEESVAIVSKIKIK